MNTTISNLVAEGKMALALAYKKAKAYFAENKHKIAENIEIGKGYAEKAVKSTSSGRKHQFQVGAWLLTNWAYINIVLTASDGIRALNKMVFAGARAVTNLLMAPMGYLYKAANKIQKMVTKTDLPVLNARARAIAFLTSVQDNVDQAAYIVSKALTNWYTRAVFFVTSTIVTLSLIVNALTAGALAAWMTGHGLVTFALLATSPGFGLFYILSLVAGAAFACILFGTYDITWSDAKRVVKYLALRAWKNTAGRFTRNHKVEYNLQVAKNNIALLETENAELHAEVSKLREAQDALVKTAQNFKAAYDMSMKPGKKGGPRLAHP